VLRWPADRGIAASRWPGVALVLGDALVDAAVDLGADPLDQAGRYRVVIRGAEVAVRPDRRGDFLVPARVHEPKVHARVPVFKRYLSIVFDRQK
jgi:hypothetical protein